MKLSQEIVCPESNILSMDVNTNKHKNFTLIYISEYNNFTFDF
jgi:hypothetical protein